MSEAPTFSLPKPQAELLPVAPWMVEEYWETFVNRRAYLRQRHTPGFNGKYSYYAPRVSKDSEEKRKLTREDVRKHLAGLITISLYAIEPVNSTCKWIAIDADYDAAFTDLGKLRQDLHEDGIEALLERSRRGAHLWIFAAEPLPADLCRLMVYNMALRLGVPIKGFNGAVDGIEIFPKQDKLEEGQFGNAIRGPLGVHRAASKRFWFDEAATNFEAQLAKIRSMPRLTLAKLQEYTEGLTMPEPDADNKPVYIPPPPGSSRYGRDTFDIRKYVTLKDRPGRNAWGQCPSCARAGRDRGKDNLAVAKKSNENGVYAYKCWAGCTADDIREAVGAPPRKQYVPREVWLQNRKALR